VQELLRLEGIRKNFGDVEVLKGIDLNVNKGEFITILGASGCGKTTLLRIIAGLERAGGGRVLLDGLDVTDDEPNRRNVRMVFQNYALFPHMNVEANIGYSLKLKHAGKAEIKKAVKEALELVRLPGYEKRMSAELSGGQRQRVAIARALVNKPPLLLLDEPLGSLDLQLRRQMQIELKRLQMQLGITFIYITHDQEEALSMSDRVAVMRSGVFEQTGSPEDIYCRPATSYVAHFVGNANVLHHKDTLIAVRTEHMNFIPIDSFPEYNPIYSTVKTAYPTRGNKDLPKLTAHIIARSFAGGQIRLTARLENGEEITACYQGINSPLQIGMKVRVRWDPENAIPLKGTD
jgi:spermidine/putrescine transport system ATP-binding protein